MLDTRRPARSFSQLLCAGLLLGLPACSASPGPSSSDDSPQTEQAPTAVPETSPLTAQQGLERGLAWLAAHQDEDGSWDSDGFMKHDPEGDLCDGPGGKQHDAGVTGLALLAFLGNGNTASSGPYKDNVARGLEWLIQQQSESGSGLIGTRENHAFLYDHGIASVALAEAHFLSRSPFLRAAAQKATTFIGQARNPYGVWRYDTPPVGDNDTSITGWMILALKSAEEGGLKLDTAAFQDTATWLDEVTSPENGRVGYSSVGERSSRMTGISEHYPTESTEAMTAVGLLCRFFLGQTPDKQPIMGKHADLMLKSLPEWDAEEGLTNDLYYWYFGSCAMFQMGGKHWSAWNKAMKTAVLGSQQANGAALGSWNPDGPWGHVGGRVYATALCVMNLETSHRYARVIGDE